MPKPKDPQKYYRLVVPVSREEFASITRLAVAEGLKNAHRWATMKLAREIRQAAEAK